MVQCKAKSKRSQEQCKNHAIRGLKVCRFLGGKLGYKKAQRARKIANLKHGFFTQESIAERKAVATLLKQAKNAIKGAE